MTLTAHIVEMDQERDRKTCLMLDLKVTGANRELAQWIADRRGRYTAEEIAGWIGCSASRIKNLRDWAEGGFTNAPHNSEKRKQREARHHDVEHSLKTNDNSESDDEYDPETGEVEESEVAAPAQVEDNILYAIQRINENARAFRKILRASALDREAVERINTAVERMIQKWRSIQSTLEKKG